MESTQNFIVKKVNGLLKERWPKWPSMASTKQAVNSYISDVCYSKHKENVKTPIAPRIGDNEGSCVDNGLISHHQHMTTSHIRPVTFKWRLLHD